jgi:predicted GNAT family N-acyltransferase
MNEKTKVIIVSSDIEYKSCLDIRYEVFVKEQNVPQEIEIDSYENESTHFLVLFNDKPVSTGRFHIKNSFLKFERIATIKSHRKKGLGSLLMQKMQEIGFKKYPQYLQVTHSQIHSIPFYEKLSWICIGGAFMEADIEHKLMIFLPKDTNYIKNLKCLQDRKCPIEIIKVLKASDR